LLVYVCSPRSSSSQRPDGDEVEVHQTGLAHRDHAAIEIDIVDRAAANFAAPCTSVGSKHHHRINHAVRVLLLNGLQQIVDLRNGKK
jgi:hypothetical protein